MRVPLSILGSAQSMVATTLVLSNVYFEIEFYQLSS